MHENDAVRASESNPDESRQRLKRRGLIAGAAALIAGTIAKNTAQPVGAVASPVLLDTANTGTGSTQILSSGTPPTFQGSYTGGASGGVGVAGTSGATGGIGVQGVANEGVGVQGAINPGHFATAPLGVQGINSASSVGATGVQGYILGTADSTFGMEGINGGAGNYRTGIQGTINATAAADVLTAGVRGLNLATGTLTLGVYGQADAAAGTGVYGQSQNGVGVKGVGFNNIGVYGVSGGGSAPFGVVGSVSAAPGFALYGVTSVPGTVGFAAGASNGAIAGQFSGPVNVYGTISLLGSGNAFVVGPGVTKNAAVKVADGTHRLMHCVEAPEPWFEDFGEGTISAGKAAVQLDPIFASTVDTSTLHVFFTEHNEHNGIHLTGRSATGFTVAADTGTLAAKGKKATDVNGTFTWRVVAKRKDVKGDRLAHFDLPKEITLAPPPLPKEIRIPPVDVPAPPMPKK